MRKTLLTLVSACLSVITLPVHADSGDIKARQQYMKEWGGLSKKMGGILKKSQTENFPAAEFAKLAAQLHQTAREPWQHYGPGTNGKGSDATPAVWEKPQQFQAAIQQFTDAINALNNTAQAGRYDAVKASFNQLSQSCKACHKTFKD